MCVLTLSDMPSSAKPYTIQDIAKNARPGRQVCGRHACSSPASDPACYGYITCLVLVAWSCVRPACALRAPCTTVRFSCPSATWRTTWHIRCDATHAHRLHYRCLCALPRHLASLPSSSICTMACISGASRAGVHVESTKVQPPMQRHSKIAATPTAASLSWRSCEETAQYARFPWLISLTGGQCTWIARSMAAVRWRARRCVQSR